MTNVRPMANGFYSKGQIGSGNGSERQKQRGINAKVAKKHISCLTAGVAVVIIVLVAAAESAMTGSGFR
jgi:hypothetical protein